MIERWLAEFDRHLRVHGRRRRQVIEELDAHLREGAAAHGEPEAVRRMGDARTVAGSFTPRAADRLSSATGWLDWENSPPDWRMS